MQKEFATQKLIQQDSNKIFQQKLDNYKENITKKQKLNSLYSFIAAIVFLGNFNFTKTKGSNLICYFDIWIISLIIQFIFRTLYYHLITQKIKENYIIQAFWRCMFTTSDEEIELQELTDIDYFQSNQDFKEIDEEVLFTEIILKLVSALYWLQIFIQLLQYLNICNSLILLILAKHHQSLFDLDEILLIIIYLVQSIKENIQMIKKYGTFPIIIIISPIVFIFLAIKKINKIVKIYTIKQKILQQQRLFDLSQNFLLICSICTKHIQNQEYFIQLQCNQNHQFHSDCLVIHMKSSLKCPVCNLSIKL